jgi:DNA-binding LytR/AlgR family response regulator
MFIAYNVYVIYRNGAGSQLNFNTYLWWIYINLIFGVPLGIIVNLVNQYYLLKRHLKIADNINKTIEMKSQVTSINLLEFEVDKFNKIQVEVDNLIYVEALGNYSNIAYNYNGFKKIAIRETITNIEQRIGESDIIFKPHRSYLVNLENIEKVTGDSQGLKIHLKGYDKVIPVSRNKIPAFRKLVKAKL